MGYEIPFRFNFNYKMTISYSPISFTLSLPTYSDPFFENDFLTDRAESMNWLSVITNGLTDDDDTTSVVTGVSSYNWVATLNLNPKIATLNPYITTLNLSNLKSSIQFSSKLNQGLEGTLSSYSPNRKFYYPAQIVPASGTINIAGTLFSYPAKSSSSSSSTKKNNEKTPEKNEYVSKFEMPSFLTLSETETSSENSENSTDGETSEKTTEQGEVPEQKFIPESVGDISSYLPELKTSDYSTTTANNVSYSLTYSIVPTLDSLIMYNSDKITTPSEISFDDEYFQSTYYKVLLRLLLSLLL